MSAAIKEQQAAIAALLPALLKRAFEDLAA